MAHVYIYVFSILAYFSPLFSTLYYTDKDILNYLSRVRLVTPQSTTKSPKPVFLVDASSAGPILKLPEVQNYGLTDIQPVSLTDPSEICISESLNSSELDYILGKRYFFLFSANYFITVCFLGFTDSNVTLGTALHADKSRFSLDCDTKCFAILLFFGTALFYTMIFFIIYKVHFTYHISINL